MFWIEKDLEFIKNVFNIKAELKDNNSTLIIRDKIQSKNIKFDKLDELLLQLKEKEFSINIETGNEMEDCYINLENIDGCKSNNFINDLHCIKKEIFDIEVRFNKIKYSDDNIYIYANLNDFIEDLENNYMNNYKPFKIDVAKNKKNTILVVNEQNLCIENNYIYICNCKNYTEKYLDNKMIEKEIIYEDKSKVNCNWNGISTNKISPLLLNFISSSNTKIINIFRKINLILIILYISNYAELKDNNILCIVNSTKRIQIEVPLALSIINISEENYNWLFKCFELAYESSSSDKLNILRNVIGSLGFCENQGKRYEIILRNSEWVYTSTHDNWEMFLSSNIDKYFEQRYKLMQSIEDKTQELQNKASDIVKDVYKNAVSLILLIVGTIVGKTEQVIRWSAAIGIVYLVIYGIAYFPLMLIEKKYIRQEFNRLLDKYRKEFNPDEEEILRRENNFGNKQMLVKIYIIGYIVVYIFILCILIFFIWKTKSISQIIDTKKFVEPVKKLCKL